MNLHPGERYIHHRGQRPMGVRPTAWLILIGAALCLIVSGIALLEGATGKVETFPGQVIERGTTLIGKIPARAAVVQIQEGPYTHQVIKVGDGGTFAVGDRVDVSLSKGRLTGELHAEGISTRKQETP